MDSALIRVAFQYMQSFVITLFLFNACSFSRPYFTTHLSDPKTNRVSGAATHSVFWFRCVVAIHTQGRKISQRTIHAEMMRSALRESIVKMKKNEGASLASRGSNGSGAGSGSGGARQPTARNGFLSAIVTLMLLTASDGFPLMRRKR